ncbi:MAG: hypothetical protein M3237_14390, partial [Actinomycetota bacterium]|nr:hypothetical protein [Actinomycetota bacterium]
MPATDRRHAPSSVPGHWEPEDVGLLLVCHDGARWLPTVLEGVAGQQVTVSCTVAVDTGSKDASAHLLAEAFGADRVVSA